MPPEQPIPPLTVLKPKPGFELMDFVEAPETPLALQLNLLLRQKARLALTHVALRTAEHKITLADLKQRCVELEKEVSLERHKAEIARRQKKIQKLSKQLMLTAPKRGIRMDAATQQWRTKARATIQQLKAEIIPYDEAITQLNGVSKVSEIKLIDRCQFLKMVGMSMVALSIWNEGVANGGGGDLASSASFTNGGSGSIWISSSAAREEMEDGWSARSLDDGDARWMNVIEAVSATAPSCSYPDSFKYVGIPSAIPVTPGGYPIAFTWDDHVVGSSVLQGNLEKRVFFAGPSGSITTPRSFSRPGVFTATAPFDNWNMEYPTYGFLTFNPVVRQYLIEKPYPVGSFIKTSGSYTAGSFTSVDDIGYNVYCMPSGTINFFMTIYRTYAVTLVGGIWQFNTTILIPGYAPLRRRSIRTRH